MRLSEFNWFSGLHHSRTVNLPQQNVVELVGNRWLARKGPGDTNKQTNTTKQASKQTNRQTSTRERKIIVRRKDLKGRG